MQCLLGDKSKAFLDIDAAGCFENVVGPERELPIAGLPRKPDAFFDQQFTESEAARDLVDIEEAQFRNAITTIGDQDRADIDAAPLGDPAIFPCRVEAGENWTESSKLYF